jgi:hypothetical protein
MMDVDGCADSCTEPYSGRAVAGCLFYPPSHFRPTLGSNSDANTVSTANRVAQDSENLTSIPRYLANITNAPTYVIFPPPGTAAGGRRPAAVSALMVMPVGRWRFWARSLRRRLLAQSRPARKPSQWASPPCCPPRTARTAICCSRSRRRSPSWPSCRAYRFTSRVRTTPRCCPPVAQQEALQMLACLGTIPGPPVVDMTVSLWRRR